MGFGSELLFLIGLGLLVLGPKRMHTLLGQLGRAKAKFDKATQDFKSQLTEELDKATYQSEDADLALLSNPSTPCTLQLSEPVAEVRTGKDS